MAELITQTGIPHWLQPPKLDRSDFYPDWVWEHALDRIAAGHTLASICEEENMPQYDRFLRWIHADEERKNRYYHAREIGAVKFEDEIINIADGLDNEMEDVQRSSLRIEARKFLLKVWNRKRYAENKQIDVNHTIDIGEAMQQAALRAQNRPRLKTIDGEIVDE